MTSEQSEPRTDQSRDDGEQRCHYCETELSGDDLTYRVLYGKYHEARDGVVSEKLAGRAGEELDPGTDERYYCLSCYKEHHDREKGAYFHHQGPEEMWSILKAADGRLVADTLFMTIGGRGWIRVVDGEVQARHSVRVRGGDDVDWDLGFETEPTPEFDSDRFEELFTLPGDRDRGEHPPVLLKPAHETPFTAGMNRTLGVNYDD